MFGENSVQRTLLPLWDFGWVDYGPVPLSGIHSAAEAPGAYFRSPEFDTSFVGPKRDELSGLHGPFLRGALMESDFVSITPHEFHAKVAQIRRPEGFSEAASDEQWLPVEALVSDMCSRSAAIYMLRFTEVDRDRFHEWGGVLDIFREFLCVGHDLSVTRVVFGYD